jgi:hypothetical protein
MLRNGFYKKAEYLAPRDSLMPLYRKYSEVIGRIKIEGYEMVYEPRTHKWLFTHLLADKYNLKNGIYLEQEGSNRHHIDFDKLNNNPDNIMRMPRKKHMAYHQEMVKYSLHTDSTKEKCRQVHQLKEYREKIRAIMLRPEMRKVLSERAKNQWKYEEYKKYMVKKFL